MALIDVSLHGRVGQFLLDAQFDVPMQGITALFGPSGCGKTTILRSVAGLNRLSGHVRIGDHIWQDKTRFVPPHKRDIGYVFQEASLFSHLSVRNNLTFGQGRTKAKQQIELDDVVSLLGLGRLIDRAPENLSGGERQRVSIGRALLSQPALLLMDEPMSALDRDAKSEILPYLEALHTELKLPILLVSHDISEVERLADHMVLLRDGKVVLAAPLNSALNEMAAKSGMSRDFAAVLPATVERFDAYGIMALRVAGVDILTSRVTSLQTGDAVRLRIAASDVSLARSRATDSSILNMLPVSIAAIEALGEAECSLALMLNGDPQAPFRARLSKRSVAGLNLQVGETVVAQIKAVSVLASR